jgi:protein-S-isoprenylcysteine O-methyltransferase Ste14
MPITQTIIITCWMAIILFWIVSSFNVKRDIGGGWKGWQRAVWVRIMIVAVVAILLHFFSRGIFGGYRTGSFLQHWSLPGNSVLSSIGAALCILGIALAIWARAHLGRNWSSHPTLKENHELVTSGPYHRIRHPIYTGLILAAFGTGLASSPWLVICFIMSLTFIRRVKKEEALMTKQFPDQYPRYKKDT